MAPVSKQHTWTPQDVHELLAAFESSGWGSMTVSVDGLNLSVTRSGEVEQPQGSVAPAADTGIRPEHTPSSTAAEATKVPAAAPASPDSLLGVRAETVGNIYVAPAPGERPFVTVGDEVKEGDQLAIIEVMKLMTAVHAPAAGVVREICVEDGTLVEYDQLLFNLEPR